MNLHDQELQRFEAQLRSLSPAPAPAELLERLKSEGRVPAATGQTQGMLAEPFSAPRGRNLPELIGNSERANGSRWMALLARWLVPAAAVVVVVVGTVILRANLAARRGGESRPTPVKADHVQIDQQLVSTFDTVAPLPYGEPVRFRCQEWMDEVVLRDTRRGVEVTRRVPRVEVVPVRFETY